MIPFFVLIGIGPYVRWKHGAVPHIGRKLSSVAVLAIITGVGIIVWLGAEASFIAMAGILLAAWTVFSAVQEPTQRLWQRLHHRHVNLARSVLGMSVAHVGAGVMILGVTVTTMLGVTVDRVFTPGSSITVHGDQYTFKGVQHITGPNYRAVQGTFLVTHDGTPVTIIYPQKREFRQDGTTTTEAAIDAGPFRDLYVALGNPLGHGAWSVRVEYKPLVRFIWLGGLIMVIGGFIAIMDKRYRRISGPVIMDMAAKPGDTDTKFLRIPER